MIIASKIASALKKELGSYFSTEAHGDNDIIRYINSAGKAIVIENNFDFSQKSTSLVVIEGTTEYDIPYQIETFFVKKGNEDIDYQNFIGYNQLTDKGNILGVWGDKAECTTPGTYDIYYRGFPTQITALTESVEMPEHFYDLLLLKATYFGFMDIQAYQKAANKEKVFKGMIADMGSRSGNPRPLKPKRLNKSKKQTW